MEMGLEIVLLYNTTQNHGENKQADWPPLKPHDRDMVQGMLLVPHLAFTVLAPADASLSASAECTHLLGTFFSCIAVRGTGSNSQRKQ